MPRSAKSVAVLRTELGGSPAMTRWVDGILTRAGIPLAERGNVVIYGSALRTIWVKEQVGDINLASPVERGARELGLPTDGGQTVPIVFAPDPLTPEEIVRRADFTICQGAYRHPWLFHSGDFRSDVQTRILCTAALTPANAEFSLLRAIKFAARGYRLTARTLQDLTRIIPLDSPPVDAVELRRHSGGLVHAG